MLIGATGTLAGNRQTLVPGSLNVPEWVGTPPAIAAVGTVGVRSLDAEERFASDTASGSWIALAGRPLVPDASSGGSRGLASQTLFHLRHRGLEAASELDGGFAIAYFDGTKQRLFLVRDAFGIELFFYAPLGGSILFGSRIHDLLRTGALPGGVSAQGLAEFLTYCYVPGTATLDEGVVQVPPGAWIEIDPDRGVIDEHTFYRLSFAGPKLADEHEIAHEHREQLERAVVRRLDCDRLGTFLSGGLDSSSIVTFARKHRPNDEIHTFSYRCAGKGFDESIYARALAEKMGTKHLELSYEESNALNIERAVELMSVPMCDIGLEMGTWLVASNAEGNADVVMTGDGGDEMWASHPVYAAQRVLDLYNKLPIPSALTASLQRMASRLPDSDQKRDLRVKLKRILPPPGLPDALGPSRWRAYYAQADLAGILTPEYARSVGERDPYRCITDAYNGYDGPDDSVTPHIYADYTILTPFYFHRLSLMRHFGIEMRFPFYDREFCEFGARIPSRLKLEKLETTKRLFRVGMEGVLPDVINHRKDKLGHSIPLKNWIRGDGPLARRVAEVLSPESLRDRGIFRPEVVEQFIREHRSRRHNHSHKIWTIFVLELWLRAREGALKDQHDHAEV